MGKHTKHLVSFWLIGLLGLGVLGTLSLGGAKARAASDALAAKGARAAIDLDKDPHLVGWWKLDEASGKTAADSSGHGHNGTLVGGLSFDKDSVRGKFGKALKLDGRDDCIVIEGFKGITGTGARTCAAWIKTKKPRGEIFVWGVDDPGKRWTFIIVDSGIFVTPKGGYLYTKSPVDDRAWHHVAAVMEGGEEPNLTNNVKLYKDGVLQEIHDIGLLDLYPINTGAGMDVRIGRGLAGLLDDVRLYDRALSAEEIRMLALPPSKRTR